MLLNFDIICFRVTIYKHVIVCTQIVEECLTSSDQFFYDQFINDLGANNHVFVYGDSEADDAEIQKHIDSLDDLIKWFGTPEQVKQVFGNED